MKRLIYLFVLFFFSTPIVFSQTQYYVNGSTGSDLQSGTSWSTAFKTLQKALSTVSSGGSIYVAQGTYVPSRNLSVFDNRTKTFVIPNGVKVYGGYKGGTGSDANTRDFVLYETVLSGDLNENDVTSRSNPLYYPSRSDNSYNVVIIYSNTNGAQSVLDGFTVTGGYASGLLSNTVGGISFSETKGAGVSAFCNLGNISLSNCTFNGNNSIGNGGAIYAEADGGVITITKDIVTDNSATGAGGLYAITKNTGEISISNSTVTNNNSSTYAGGIYVESDGGLLSVANSTFSNNTASLYGGGLAAYTKNTGSTIQLSTLTVSGNSASTSAGGISLEADKGAITLDSTSVSNNTSFTYGGGIAALANGTGCLITLSNSSASGNASSTSYGGGISLEADAGAINMNNCTASNNSAFTTAGGMSVFAKNTGSSINLTYINAENNYALSSGAGITLEADNSANVSYIYGNVLNNNAKAGGGGMTITSNLNATVLAENVFIQNNSAIGAAGGLTVSANLGATAGVIGCVISGNSATLTAGAMTINSGTLANINLINNTIVSNRAEFIGGSVIFTGFIGSSTLANTVFWGNTTAGSVDNFNLLQLWNSLTTLNNVVQDKPASAGFLDATNMNVNQMFANFSGGIYRVPKNSPLINAGDNTLAAGVATDIAGNIRIHQDIVDIGAYEYVPPTLVYVDSSATGLNTGTSWIDAFTSLDNAFTVTGVNEILIAKGTYTPSIIAGISSDLRDKAFVIPSNVVLSGGYNSATGIQDTSSNKTILNGNLGGGNYAYHVVIATNTNATDSLQINNITVTGGNANGTGSNIVNGVSVPRNSGGGIFVSSTGPSTITQTNISGNNASLDGGGIFVTSSGSITNITKSSIINNAANNGGGVYISGAPLTISGNTITGNSATNNGGGIYADATGNSYITNNLIWGNNAANAGGIYAYVESGDILYMINNTAVYNTAAQCGGIYYDNSGGGSIHTENTIVWGNTASNIMGISGSGNSAVTYSLIQGYDNSEISNLSFISTSSKNPDGTIYTGQQLFVDTILNNYQLTHCSPALNAGNNGYLTSSMIIDLEGNNRVINTIVDLGAYESEAYCLFFSDSTYAYTGLPQSLFVTGLPSNATVSYVNNEQSTAGTYTVTATVSIPGATDTTLSATLTITQVPLTITARNITLMYGTNPASVNLSGAYDISGFVNNESTSALTSTPTLNISSSITSTTESGTYPGTISASGALATNYTISYVSGSTIIIQNTGHYVILDSIPAKTYGDTPFVLTGRDSIGGLVTFASSDPSVISVDTLGNAIIYKAGMVTLYAIFPGNANLVADTVSQIITISPAPLTITANDTNRLYNQVNPSFSVTFNGLKLTDTPSDFGTLNITTTATQTSPIGTYPITPSGASNPNYTITFVDGILTVDPASITGLTFNSNTSAIYTGLSQSLSLTGLPSGATVVYTNNNQTNAGTYVVTATVSMPRYNDTTLRATLIINQAPITITARNITLIYGTNPSSLNLSGAYDISGFVNNEDISVLNSMPTVSIASFIKPNSVVGTYPGTVNVSGASASNYVMNTISGSTLIVQNTGHYVVLDSIPNKRYGDIPFVLTGRDSIGGSVIFASSNPSVISVDASGNANIHKTGIVTLFAIFPGNADLVADTVSQTLTISPAPLTIAANNTNRPYYQNNPSFTLSFYGLKYTDTSSDFGPINITTTATQTSPAGTYSITAFGATNSNYTIAYAEGTMMIEKAKISLVLESGKKGYTGSPIYFNPPLVLGKTDGSSLPFYFIVQKDTINSQPVQTSSVTESGNYSVTAVSQGNENYASAVSNTIVFTVNKTGPKIVGTSKSVNYTGNPIPVDKPVISGSTTTNSLGYTLTYTGINGTNYAASQTPPSAIGQYEATITLNGDNNHGMVTSKSIFVIGGSKVPILAITDKIVTYDGTPKSITATVIPSNLGVSYTYEGTKFDGTTYLSTQAPSDAGTYMVTAVTSADSTYNAVALTANLSITRATPTIIIQNKSIGYTGESISLAVSSSTPSDIQVDMTYVGIDTTNYPSNTLPPVNEGIYKVYAYYAGNNNYTSTTVTGNLTIGAAGSVGLLLDGKVTTYNGSQQPINKAQIITKSNTIDYLYYGSNYPISSQPPVNLGVYNAEAIYGLSVTATLIINKAAQLITFESNQLKDRKIGDTLRLSAIASSNLPVSFVSGNPNIVSIENDKLTVINAGAVMITAIQAGSENYYDATPVSYLMVLPEPELTIDSMLINGVKHDIREPYQVDCSINELQIEISTLPGTLVDPRNTFTINMNNYEPGIIKIPVIMSSLDGINHNNDTLTINKWFEFDDIIVQKMDNTLMLNLRKLEEKYNDQFHSYKWYQNDNVIGAGSYYSAGKYASDLLDQNTAYYVEMIKADGSILRSCAKKPVIERSNISIYPNPLASNDILTIKITIQETESDPIVIEMYTITGIKISETIAVGNTTQIPAPNEAGIYVVKIKTNKGLTESYRIVVK